MVHSRNKGKAGEYEFIKSFQPLFKEPLKRNLEQTRAGGSDIIGCEPWVIEVKNVNKQELNAWWRQVCLAAKTLNMPRQYAVVAYKKPYQGWQFLLSAELICTSGPTRLEDDTFIIVKHETFIRVVTAEANRCSPTDRDSPAGDISNGPIKSSSDKSAGAHTTTTTNTTSTPD